MHAVEFGALDRQRPVARAERQDQMIEGQRRAGRHHDAARRAVDRRYPVAENELDRMLLIVAQRPQQQSLAAHLAEQIGLRQRRALIGRDALVADQHDRLLIAVLAQ